VVARRLPQLPIQRSFIGSGVAIRVAGEMLRIDRKTDGASIVLTVSGRLRAENVDELRQSLERMAPADSIVLELADLILADREAVKFLGESEACGRIVLRNCPAYIRQWIAHEDSR
jgi:hypothetical protein